MSDPDSLITKSLIRTISYTYYGYGLPSTEITTVPSSSNKVERNYTYETSDTSKIFGALLSESDEVTDEKVYYYDNYNGRLLSEVGMTGGMGTAYTYDALGDMTFAFNTYFLGLSHLGITK